MKRTQYQQNVTLWEQGAYKVTTTHDSICFEWFNPLRELNPNKFCVNMVIDDSNLVSKDKLYDWLNKNHSTDADGELWECDVYDFRKEFDLFEPPNLKVNK